MNKEDKVIKAAVGVLLKKTLIDMGGHKVPILGKATSQIVINCNEGEVTDVKPTFRIK